MGGWQANWEREMLERIIALLFSLADLAERAAGAPYLHRRQVLAILSHGEAEARAFVIGIATGLPAAADGLETADDTACLAARFRALALALFALLERAALTALPGAAEAVGLPADGCGSCWRMDRRVQAPVFDTS